MTGKQAHALLITAVVAAILAVALLIIVSCTIVIGDSNRVDQEINTDSRLRSRVSVDDTNNKSTTTKDPQQSINGDKQ